jgi:hypothetical protein
MGVRSACFRAAGLWILESLKLAPPYIKKFSQFLQRIFSRNIPHFPLYVLMNYVTELLSIT